jgi:hypothetical protein
MADGMAEWQKEWQNGRMAGMDTYVLFMVHADTDTNNDDDNDDDDDDDDDDDTLIFYSIDWFLKIDSSIC